ncbi:HPP family protein [Gordonia sp. CPCC 205515]|uniref:HPP family protein n=1 Tax=Gordonia sp. CPCC 205515 TaxID=3140791 RepID=UPI003AF347BE
MTARLSPQVRAALRGLGPAHSAVSPREAIRAGLGAALGLAVVGMVLMCSGVDLQLGLYMIAPFGATTVLVFAAPNSPLAQPWPAVVGNTVAALVGVAVTILIDEPVLRVALAVGLAVAAMILCHAVHPPAGAVALTAALSPEAIHALGFRFALAPVAVGTVLLVALAIVYARLTGRRYPFRQFDAAPPPAERLGLSEDELTGILERYQQSLNLGVADLARLVGAAEMQAATHLTGPLTAADIMSRDLITVRAETTITELAALFRAHGFTSLPVVAAGYRYLGVVFQLHLVDRLPPPGRAWRSLVERPSRRPGAGIRADELMAVDLPVASTGTPIAALLPMLSDSGYDAIPVLDGEILVGIVTQTDLITALARQTLHAA